MTRDFAHTQGSLAALNALHLEKNANAFTQLGRGLRSVGRVFSTNNPAYVRAGNQLGSAIEKRVLPVIPQRFHEPLNTVFKGVPKRVVGELGPNMALGAILGAPLGAMLSDPEHRTEGAATGALQGIRGGLVYGALGGLTRGIGSNLTQQGLRALGGRQGLSGPRNALLAHKIHNQSWARNAKQMVLGGGPLGRSGAALATLGPAAGVALGDIYLPYKVDKAIGHPETLSTEPYQRTVTANDKSKEPLISKGMVGSFIGGPVTNITTRALLHRGKFPFQAKMSPFVKEITPIVTTSTGGMTGYITAKKLDRSKK